MAEKTETVEVIADAPVSTATAAGGNLTTLTVEELYDKDKFDLSTMELEEVLKLLQYVSRLLVPNPISGWLTD